MLTSISLKPLRTTIAVAAACACVSTGLAASPESRKAAKEPTPMARAFETDTIKTSAGDIEITFIGHGTLMFRFAGKVVHVDPWSSLADYAKLPDADIVLLTHHHRDHLDPVALREVRVDRTVVVLTEQCTQQVGNGVVMKNGDTREIGGINVEAVPAYNIVHRRDNGQPYHPKGEGNGYILSFGGKRVYIAGDTEGTPEMKALKDIDVAFLPMNLPYTMTPEMVAEAAKAFAPRILYPYHFGKTPTSDLVRLLQQHPETDVRVRRME